MQKYSVNSLIQRKGLQNKDYDVGLSSISTNTFQINDYAHILSRECADRCVITTFEKLNGKNHNYFMVKSITGAARNQLIQYTAYNAENAGRGIGLNDPSNTPK